MNDRYLYRAKLTNWRELPKEMWWVEGYYAYFKQNDNHCIYYETDGFTLVCDIDISTLCACTGLNSKNGKLIWENDILVGHLDDKFPEDATYARVLWHNNGFCTQEHYSSDVEPLDEFDQNNFEVCGNVFDNPERGR